jgi:hypothetical protein
MAEHTTAADRLSAIVARGRLELPLYANIDVPLPEAVQRRFWTPEECVVSGTVE